MQLMNAIRVCGVFLLLGGAFGEQAAAEGGDPIRQCALDLCQTISGPHKNEGDLTCSLSQTWNGAEINKALQQKKLSWTYGDPACVLDLKVQRAILVSAATTETYTLKVPTHKVNCEVEQNGAKTPVTITLAPEVKLKKGEATSVLLRVTQIEGPKLIQSVIWSTAKLEDNFGIFHGDLVKGINNFIKKECPKTLAGHETK
jgi:hypothetical protein